MKLDVNPFFFQRGDTGCLLIHGGTGSPPEMRGMGEYLAGEGITVLGVRLPGHGTTPGDLAGRSWQEMVASAEEGLVKLQSAASQVFVAGLSMGGLLALHLAAHHPLQGVIAMSAPAYLRDWRLRFLPLARTFIRWHTQPAARLVEPGAEARLFYYRRVPLGFIAELLRLIELVRGELPRVEAPLLVMQGAHDTTIPSESGRVFLEGVSSGVKELVLFPNSGHAMTVDGEREQVWERAVRFIRSVSA